MYKVISLVFTFFIFFGLFIPVLKAEPTSAPKMVLPIKAPPTKAELKKLKCEKDEDFIGTDYCKDFYTVEEKGFFEIIWKWFLSLFN